MYVLKVFSKRHSLFQVLKRNAHQAVTLKHYGDLAQRIVHFDEPHMLGNELQFHRLLQKLYDYSIFSLSVENFLCFTVSLEDGVSQKSRK